ncbi:UNVERIFIED_CONTAM: hypothetical protein GTU68_037988, partial [Idotea baltica]|nr:hypothetical protein [Idotea baltica]MCL4156579.1 hypothetical protein [Idotea baltica]
RGGPGTGGDFRGKREFDRHSGTGTSGVKQVDKRDGSGSYNWGSDKDQIEEQLQVGQTADLDTSAENADKPAGEEGSGAPGDDDSPKDDDQREMTLDEWKALQKRDKPIFKTRRAGEGENTAQWKKTYVLKKKIAQEESDEEEEDDDEEEVHHGRKKVLLPIDFQFKDTPTRGRGRGRGGRG